MCAIARSTGARRRLTSRTSTGSGSRLPGLSGLWQRPWQHRGSDRQPGGVRWEFGLLFSLPLWFQNVRGYSAFETGLALLPLAIGSFVASGFGAQLAQRRGPTFAVRLGILLELVGVVGVGIVIGIVIGPRTAWWATVPVLFRLRARGEGLFRQGRDRRGARAGRRDG